MIDDQECVVEVVYKDVGFEACGLYGFYGN